MSETLICPRIIWKVDLSSMNSTSRSYCQSMHILKSFWRLIIEVDEEWDEYKVFIMPENPEMYLNMRFFIQCGVRDTYGICRFEYSQTTTTQNLSVCNVWGASRRLLLEESLIHNNLLWIICTVEPESSWEDCQSITDSLSSGSSCTSTPCTDELIADFEYLLRQAAHHDVILECENETIKAHKSVLSCRSKVFEAMFRHHTKEAREGKVVIRDTSFRIFQKVIRYIYTAEITFEDIDFACKIYAEADKYMVLSLKERCQIFFKTYLCASCHRGEVSSKVSDACRILFLADKHSDITLQCCIENYLADSALLVTPEWKAFAEDNTDVAIKIYFKLLNKVKFGKSNSFITFNV